ncbi:VTC domain-containing protein, partial [Polaribacter sp.]|nr:VTC domain-containing protein [Polaribacter sp.]
TKKSRIELSDFELDLSEKSKEFILKTTQESMELKPVLWNHFNRITLVNLKDNERVTIDLGLAYSMNEIEKKYENLVIVEVKQPRFNRNSRIVQILKKYRYNPFSISKYCIGMVHLYQDLKYNLFKSKVLKINKISF